MIVAVVLFGNFQKIWSQKNIGTILLLLNGLTFGTSQFYKGDPHQTQDSSLYVQCSAQVSMLLDCGTWSGGHAIVLVLSRRL